MLLGCHKRLTPEFQPNANRTNAAQVTSIQSRWSSRCFLCPLETLGLLVLSECPLVALDHHAAVLAERFGHCIRLRCSAASGLLRPDPLQGLAKLAFAHRSCQISLSQGGADPPDVQTTEDQGDQTQLEVSGVHGSRKWDP